MQLSQTLGLLLLCPLLVVGKFLSGSTAEAIPWKQTTNPKTFADWCLNKANLSVETKHTVNAMLQQAKTTDCHQAEKLLSTRTQLSLNNNQITDLKPLSTLTHLSVLFLNDNQITDLKPLSTLTHLTLLSLNDNQSQHSPT